MAVEILETRSMLSALFVPAAPVAPAENQPDVPLGRIDCCPVEPMVAVNDLDPANVIVTGQSGIRVSTDGGRTFSGRELFPLPEGATGSSGDPDIAFDGLGRLYWANLADLPDRGAGDQLDIAVARIDPRNGRLMGRSTNVNQPNDPLAAQNDDKAFLVADQNPASPFANRLYVVWTKFDFNDACGSEVFLSYSSNRARTWSAAVAISDRNGRDNLCGTADDEGFVWPPDVSVASNGDVYVAYHSQAVFNGSGDLGGNPDGASGQVFVVRSTDGGATFPQRSSAFPRGSADVTFNIQNSSTGVIPGATFWTQGSVQPFVLADPVRPGQVYVIAADNPDNRHGSGDDGDVFIARSTDHGATWQVLPVSAGPGGTFQLFPTAAIDPFGTIVVAWYDNRRGETNADGHFLLDVFVRYSIDGGITWSSEFRVNDSPFDPDAGAITRSDGPPPTTRIGEYFGVDAHGGTAYIAWNGNRLDALGNAVDHQVLFDTFPIAGTLTIRGDDTGRTDDAILVRALATNADYVEVLVNGQHQYTGLRAALTGGMSILGRAGHDRVTFDFGNGNPLPPGPVSFVGGNGKDRIVSNADADYRLHDDRLAMPGIGTATLSSVEQARLTAGPSNNIISTRLYSGLATVNAGAGDDLVRGGAAAERLLGDSGNDTLRGKNGDDLLDGGDGDDLLDGGDGDDTLLGAAGFDSMLGELGSDSLDGGDDGDTLSGGSEDDMLAGGAEADLLFGDDGLDQLFGGDGSDTLSGGADDDLLDGAADDDQLQGDSGNDTLRGGLGLDTLLGGAGDDSLDGLDDAADLLDGDLGTDLCDGDAVDDVRNCE